MKVKEKYRTIEVNIKNTTTTEHFSKEKFLVEDDFNEKDFDWDKFFLIKTITYQNDGLGESGIPSTHTGEIIDVVEGEEYSSTSPHDISPAPNNGISFGGFRTTLLDDCGMKLFHHKRKVSSQLNDAPDASTTS